MLFEPDDYYRAAHERLRQATDLYRRDAGLGEDLNHHPLALYAAGVAVECMLRAFITRRTQEFDARHNPLLLFEQSGILDIDSASASLDRLSDVELRAIKKEIGGAVGVVARLWNNAFRYAGEGRLRSHLHELRLDRNIKGDALKENLRRLLEAARRIIDRGTYLWEASTSSPRS